MEITITITIPDVRADVAAFAASHALPIMYGDYEAESEDEEGIDYALLVSVGHNTSSFDAAPEVWEEFEELVGVEDLDKYTGEEYWAVFHDRASLDSCLAQFGAIVKAQYPETRFEYAPFLD